MATLYIKWDKQDWPTILIPLLCGMTLEALSVEDRANYDVIKQAILERYKLNEEAYRKRFRSAWQENDESFREFRVRMKGDFNCWLERERITNSNIM